jgi:hypothetical protein
MSGEIFPLKFRDTRPIIEVALVDPDGDAHDLSGVDAVWLHVWLSTGAKFSREMYVYGAAPSGLVRYDWETADWDTTNASGYLVVSPDWTRPNAGYHRMEYETIRGGERLTFPNDGYDVLRVVIDVAQGA